MSKIVAQQLVEELERVGVKHLYAIAGDSLNHVNIAVRNSKSIDWIHVRHEECGAFAAEAEALLNGVGCCAGSSGPGHVHLINGLYDANHNHAPVIAIASTCASTEFGTDFFQETDTIKLFDDCSIYNQVASTPLQFSRMLPAVLRYAAYKQQVAVVGLPGDVAAMPADYTYAGPAEFGTPCCTPSPAKIEQLAKILNESKRTALFCGIGARDAMPQIKQLAQKIKAPIISTYRAKMYVQPDNPAFVGLTGLLGTPPAYIAMHDADLILMIGTDFPFTAFIPARPRIAQMDIRPERIGRRAPVELAIEGDAAAGIAMLLPLVEAVQDDKFLKKSVYIYDKSQEDLNEVAQHKGREGEIAPEYLTALLDKYAAENAIITVDTGMCCSWSARYINQRKAREVLASFGHGSMCNALPMAIGAALARPGQQVVAMCGDGGLSMLLGELATVAQYKLPIKIIVFNNRALGMVKLEMEVDGLVDSQTDMFNPNFAQVAEAVGIPASVVTDPSVLEGVLAECLRHEGAMLLDVHTDANAMSVPPDISLGEMKGFSLAILNMLKEGKTQEVIDIIKSNLKLL